MGLLHHPAMAAALDFRRKLDLVLCLRPSSSLSRDEYRVELMGRTRPRNLSRAPRDFTGAMADLWVRNHLSD